MPKPTAEQIRDRAWQAAVEAAPPATVGDFVGFVDESDDVITMKFATRQKGYVGWNWHISLYVGEDELTVSEVNLLPGDNSLLAPDWVPWADRLADWKALQAELEAQAAAEAAEAEETEVDDADDEDAGNEDIEAENDDSERPLVAAKAGHVESSESFEESEQSEMTESVVESAVALEENGDETETDADDAGQRPPRFLRRRLGRLKKKK